MNKFYITPFLLLVIGLLFGLQLNAQNVVESYGARAAALGNSATCHSDAFSTFSNQAGLADVEEMSVGVFGENRFLIPDLNSFAFGFALPTKSGTFGVAANYYGIETYNTLRATLGYGRTLFEEKMNIGAGFDFVNVNVPEYGSKAIITFGVGVQFKISDFMIAGHVFNPIQSKTTENEKDVLSSTLKLGISYVPSQTVGIYLEGVKTFNYPASFNGGVEYNVLKKLELRVGFATLPSRIVDGRYGTDVANLTVGAGIILDPIRIDIANKFHPVLGHSPSVSISYSGKKKTNPPVPTDIID